MKWYEYNMKLKYPNGVLCRCKRKDGILVIDVIKDVVRSKYHTGEDRIIFCGTVGQYIEAKPISPENAPAIIREED